MSSAPDPHGSDAHDAHDAHAFTGEPVQVLAPDEPRTPGWLPLLGVALFTGAAVIFLAGSGGPEPTAQAKPEQAQPVPEQAPRPTPAAPVTVATAPRQAPSPAAPTGPKPTPEKIKRVRQALDDAKARGAAGPH